MSITINGTTGLILPASTGFTDPGAVAANAVAAASGASTADKLLTLLLTVDVDNSGLNATTLKSTTPGTRGLTALSQATVLDADTVSGYGIGVNSNAVLTTFATTIPGGKYHGINITGAPNTDTYSIEAITDGTYDTYWMASQTTGACYVGLRLHGTGAVGWRQIYNSGVGATAGSDGNGGQPPAPKPSAGLGAVPGKVVMLNGAGVGNYYANGTTSAGGTERWYVVALLLGSTGLTIGNAIGEYAGSTNIVTVGATQTLSGSFWRLT